VLAVLPDAARLSSAVAGAPACSGAGVGAPAGARARTGDGGAPAGAPAGTRPLGGVRSACAGQAPPLGRAGKRRLMCPRQGVRCHDEEARPPRAPVMSYAAGVQCIATYGKSGR